MIQCTLTNEQIKFEVIHKNAENIFFVANIQTKAPEQGAFSFGNTIMQGFKAVGSESTCFYLPEAADFISSNAFVIIALASLWDMNSSGRKVLSAYPSIHPSADAL